MTVKLVEEIRGRKSERMGSGCPDVDVCEFPRNCTSQQASDGTQPLLRLFLILLLSRPTRVESCSQLNSRFTVSWNKEISRLSACRQWAKCKKSLTST